MFQRLRRTTISFGLVFAAYLAYRFTAVPLLEPPVVAAVRSAEFANHGNAAPSGDPRLARVFPPRSWPLDDPIRLENDHSQLLMQKYTNLPDGRVEMFPCAIVIFPSDSSGSSDSDATQGRVIVIEAPQGAVAQFDQPLDLQKGKIGRLLGAQFHGPVTIRGTPSRPGGTDDILVTTQNVQMNTDQIWTAEPVEFRFGQNVGHGRDLRIHLLPSAHGGEHGPSIGGIQTIELMHDVQMRLVSGASGGIMPTDARHRDDPSASNAAAPAAGKGLADENPPAMPIAAPPRAGLPAPVADLAGAERQRLAHAAASRAAVKKPTAERDPPVDIRCKGEFRFDMARYMATFEDQVDVLRTPRDGPSDQMTCEQLIIHFAPRDPPVKAGKAGPTKPVGNAGGPSPVPSAAAVHPQSAASDSSNQKLPNLEPRRIEARGHPVIVRAPSNHSYSRCEHLDYDILAGQISLDGSDEVMMQQQLNEIHARSIVYQPGEAGRLGRLLAIGPGWLRGVPPQSAQKQPGPTRPADNISAASSSDQPEAAASAQHATASLAGPPAQLFEAHWTRELKMRPYEQNHVISLIGDARAGFTGQGELSADEIHLWLLEPPPAEKTQAAPIAGAAPKPQIRPDRMLAIGQVRINSPQLMGTCARLEAWFQQRTSPLRPSSAQAVMADGLGAPGAAASSAAANAPSGPSNNADAPFRAVASPNGFMPAIGGAARFAPNHPTQRYEVDGQRIRVQLVNQGEATTVEDLAVDGQVHLVEVQTPAPGDQPLRVGGESLQVVRASDPTTAVTISGHPAQVASRGMEMYGDVIQLDKGTNRLWIDGPGRMKLPANQLMSDSGGLGAPLMTGARGGSRGAAPTGAAAAPIFIDWQGRMAFDGLLARFERSVVCQTETRSLRTELLDVTMRQRVNFAQPQAGQHTDVGRIFCHGDVLMENRGFDPRRLLTDVERLRAHDLTIDQTTGLIDGRGPGWLTSVRRGERNLGPLGAAPRQSAARSGPIAQPIIPTTTQSNGQPAGAHAARQPAGANGRAPGARIAANPDPLTYLNVQFQGPISGNLNDHEITFHDQVHTIYGPVPTWDGQLNFDKMQDLGPDDELMSCDQLTLRQGAIVQQPGQADRRPMEMESAGNVSIEGATFRALASRMTYAEAKDLLVLEGDGRNDAELFRQDRVGAPPTRVAARKILYRRAANQVSVNDARIFDLNQGLNPSPPPSLSNGKATGKKPAPSKKTAPSAGGF